MDGVDAAQGMTGSELAGILLDSAGELHRACRGPELLPGLLGGGLAGQTIKRSLLAYDH